ncbi:GreA/GreB family elongation factor [Bradyrhizobium sp. NC92]|uniref:GreA/GreB family elongation factor n=1 Tax=Bradyrhizobium sp. (strain NC92) TaxID=55395 RepID=UPI0039065908
MSVVMPRPSIALTESDYTRLNTLARVAAQQGGRDGMCLLAEIDRAKILSDNAPEIKSLVAIGSWVAFWTNLGIRRRTVQLVWPEDVTSNPTQISVLSGLGVALVGLRAGDHMPYFTSEGMDVLRIETVNQAE